MDKATNWDEVIIYHEIPFFTPTGFYQFKYNKIYINELVKKYPEYHNYVRDHEKQHNNNNSNKTFLQKVYGDIKIDWTGSYTIQKKKGLNNEIKLFKNEKRRKEVDGKIRMHYFLTKNLRPDSLIIWVPLVLSICLITWIHLIILPWI